MSSGPISPTRGQRAGARSASSPDAVPKAGRAVLGCAELAHSLTGLVRAGRGRFLSVSARFESGPCWGIACPRCDVSSSKGVVECSRAHLRGVDARSHVAPVESASWIRWWSGRAGTTTKGMSRGQVRAEGQSLRRDEPRRLPDRGAERSVRPTLEEGATDAREKPLGAAVPPGAGEYIFVRR